MAEESREDLLKRKVKLVEAKREAQKKINAINDSQKGSTREFTAEQSRQLRLNESTIRRLDEQIAAIDKKLGS